MFGIQDPMANIAIIALVSPIITTLINNAFQTWREKNELNAKIRENITLKEIDIINEGLLALGQTFGANKLDQLNSSETAARIMRCRPFLSLPGSSERIMHICYSIQQAEDINYGQVQEVMEELSSQINLRTAEVKQKSKKH